VDKQVVQHMEWASTVGPSPNYYRGQ